MGEPEQLELLERAPESISMTIRWDVPSRMWNWRWAVRLEAESWQKAGGQAGFELALDDALDQLVRTLGRSLFG